MRTTAFSLSPLIPPSTVTFGAGRPKFPRGPNFEVPKLRQGMSFIEEDIKRMKKEGIRPKALGLGVFDLGPDKTGLKYEVRSIDACNASGRQLTKYQNGERVALLDCAHASWGDWVTYYDKATLGGEVPKGRGDSQVLWEWADKLLDSICEV